MQAKDLIVLGSSRLLGKLYCNDIDIGTSLTTSGSITAEKISINIDANPNSGNLGSADSTTNNVSMVIGNPNGRHIAFDPDEIQGKSAKTTVANLWLNYGGGTVYLSNGNAISANNGTLTANTITMNSNGTITTTNLNTTEIKATNVNVTNKLYALKYDLESVADLGGSFIVAPTLVVPNSTQATDSNASLTVAKSGNTLTLTVKDPSISTNQIAGFTWTQNYKVKVSGKISNTAIGTCTGKITSTNLSSTQMTLSVTCDSNIASQITAGSYQIANYNLNIMLYNADTSASGETKPIGIWLQSYGLTKNPTIEIWNGEVNVPKVRLGYLNGITYNGKTLGSVWGLYSDSVYLEGNIIAKGGKIAGWTIGDGYITTNDNRTTYNNTSYTGMTMNFSNSSGGIGARGSASKYFNLSIDGGLTAVGATIQTATIGNGTNKITIGVSSGSNAYSSIVSGMTKLDDTANNGFYIGTDGIALGKGVFKVTNAGYLTSTSGKIGSINITGSDLHSGSKTTYNSTNTGFFLGSDGKFGIGTSTNYLTFDGTNLKIKGNIEATSGFIGQNETNGFKISNTAIYNPSTKSSLNSDSIDGVYLGKDGIALGKGVFKVTSTGSMTSTSGRIGGWDINDDYLNRSKTESNGIVDTISLNEDGVSIISDYSNYSLSSSFDTLLTAISPGSFKLSSTSSGSIITQTLINSGYIYLTSGNGTADINPEYIEVNRNSTSSNSTIYQGYMTLTRGNGASYIKVSYNDTYSCSLHASTAGNRGIYDDCNSIWMIQKDTNNNVAIRADGNQVSLVNTTGKNVHFYYNTSNTTNYFRPSATGMRLADSTYPWDYIFSAHALQTSDLKKKSIIKDFDWKVDEFIRGLKPIAYNRIKDSGEISRRIDLGFGAQDVSKLSKKLNIGDLALYNANIIDYDNEGNPIEKDYHGEDIDDKKLSWSLDYSEFIAPMVLEIQRLMDRIDKLEFELKKYKS